MKSNLIMHKDFALTNDKKNSSQEQTVQRKLYVNLARTQAEIEEAQRLRYKVFAEEMGAQLSGIGGLDIDGFDQFCDHLIVRRTPKTC